MELAPNGTPTIDVGGRLILPAFTDAHIHFHDMAERRGQVELYTAPSLDDLLDRIGQHAEGLPPEAWVLGYGWNESDWPEAKIPHPP